VEVLARLDKTTRLRVLCGAVGGTCRGELATVRIWKGMRVLCMPAGSKHIARGHYRTTKHSLERARKATAAVRRGDLLNGVDQLAARRHSRTRSPIPKGKDLYLSVYEVAGEVVVEQIPKVGILMDCPIPSCERTNVLLGPNLDVATE
jgi:hypothetical protein